MSESTLPVGTRIACDDWEAEDGFQIGDDVIIECRRVRVGRNVEIGVRTNENFRRQSGVRIQLDELLLGDGVVIGREVLLRGGCFHLEKKVRVREGSTLHVEESLRLQPYGVINENCEISGVDIDVGRYLWMLPYAKIGGGSAFEVHSKLRVGHFCHLGMYSFINTARLVKLGDEVGLGTRTALYTHGAYPSILQGFPVAFGEIHIGDRSWLPGAIVNPGVTIGRDCVIGVGAVVTGDIPDGALAGGVPARVIRERAFPKKLLPEQKRAIMTNFLQAFSEICRDRHCVGFSASDDSAVIIRLDGDQAIIAYDFSASTNWIESLQSSAKRVICIAHEYGMWLEADALSPTTTAIDLEAHKIVGQTDYLSERLLNQMRRYGVRFRYSPEGGEYVAW